MSKLIVSMYFSLFQYRFTTNTPKATDTSQVVPAQSRTRGKPYPFFLTPKSYPILAGVYHLIPADCQVVPTSILTICSANWYPCQLVPFKCSFHRSNIINVEFI